MEGAPGKPYIVGNIKYMCGNVMFCFVVACLYCVIWSDKHPIVTLLIADSTPGKP